MRIQDVIETLNAMQADGVVEKYAIGGAVGATFYLEPLATVDVDVFVEFNPPPGKLIVDPRPIFDYLSRRGFAMEGEYVVVGGWPVQFLSSLDPLVQEALADSIVEDVEGVPARVFTAEHLAAIALRTGRAKDKARLLQFFESGVLDRTRWEDILSRHGLKLAWDKFRTDFLGDEA